MLIPAVISLALLSLPAADNSSNVPVPALPTGTHVAVLIRKTIKARKAHSGDPVSAELLFPVLRQGKVIIPRGARLTGHVTAAQRRSRHEDESFLRIRFDRAVWNDGTAEMNAYVVGRLPEQRRVRPAMEYNPAACNGDVATRPEQQVRGNPADMRRSTNPPSSTADAPRPPRSCSSDAPMRQTRSDAIHPATSEFEGVFIRTLTRPAGATELMSPTRNVTLPAGTLVELRQVGQ